MNPRRDAARVERGQRRHHVLGRAHRVVLMPVLDVGDPVGPEEPGVELDARDERGLVEIGVRTLRETREDGLELGANGVPVELDVVVAVHHRERVPGRDELGERRQHLGVALGDAPELLARMVGGVSEAVGELFLVGDRVEARTRSFGGDRHADEVDEVTRDRPPATAP